MAPHLLEEAYEAIEAIQQANTEDSCEELGDVLMNVLMIAQIASEAGRYTSEDVARAISDKLVRRHPHVFGELVAEDSDTVLQNWEQIKKEEKGGQPRGALDGVPVSLPALQQALRIGEKAHRTGFDWPDARGPRAKLDEELAEMDEALAAGDAAAAEAELGDVLFSLANLARHAGINPEMALRRTCQRFRSRFQLVEEALGARLKDCSLAEMEAAWEDAKRKLRT